MAPISGKPSEASSDHTRKTIKRRKRLYTRRKATKKVVEPILEEGGEVYDKRFHYEVKRIVDAKYSEGKILYLVRWKGFGSSNDSWVDENMTSCSRKISQFWDKVLDVKNPKTRKYNRVYKCRDMLNLNIPPVIKIAAYEMLNQFVGESIDIDSVLDASIRDGELNYYCRLPGFDSSHNRWVAETNLGNSYLMIRTFWAEVLKQHNGEEYLEMKSQSKDIVIRRFCAPFEKKRKSR